MGENSLDPESPIGVFDSGLGGLSVVEEIQISLPNERILYCADSVHLPYGNKRADEIQEYSLACVKELVKKGIKVLLIACHTASIPAKKLIEKNCSIPVFGIHEASIEALALETHTKNLGIIGTEATIRSNYYQFELKNRLKQREVFQIAAPTLVPLIEKKQISDEEIIIELKKYYNAFQKHSIDTLLLACTHFPLIFRLFQKTFPSIHLIDPSKFFVKKLAEFLKEKKMLAQKMKLSDSHEFWVTGDSENFKFLASHFLTSSVEKVFHLDLIFEDKKK